MRHNTSVRRSVALAAATALISGGLATGLAAPAFAAGSITSFSPSEWDNRSTVTMTVIGTGFPVPLLPTDRATLLFKPVVEDLPNEVAEFAVSADTNTATKITAKVPLAMAPPGLYTLRVADENGANPSPAAVQKFKVYGFGSANATGVAFGSDPSGSEIECATVVSCESRAISGKSPLDITGSNIAIGAKVRFLKPVSLTPDTLTFTQNNPNNSENNLGTEDADGRAGTGYASTTLLQGNYGIPADASATEPGFTPGLHKLQVMNTDGLTAGATVDFAQPWFPLPSDSVKPLSPSGIGVGAKDVVVTLTGQGIRAGSSLSIESKSTSSCAGVTTGPSTVSGPDGAGTFTKISAPVSMADCTTDNTDPRAVTVVGPDGARFTRNAVFNIVTSPTFGSISDGFEVLGQGARVGYDPEVVTITGTGFQGQDSDDPAKMTKFSFGEGVVVTTEHVLSPGSAQVHIDVANDAPVGDRVATVTNPDGGSSSKAAATLPPGPAPLAIEAGPKVTSVSPSSLKSSAAGQTVTINGTFDADDDYVVKVCDHLGTTVCTESPNVTEDTPAVTASALTFHITTNGASAGPRDLLISDTTDHGRLYCTSCMAVDTLVVSPSSQPNTGDATLTFSQAEGIETVTPSSTATLTRTVAVSGQGPIQLKSGTQLAPGPEGSNTASGTFALSGVVPGKYSVLIVKDPGPSPTTTWSCTGCFTVTGTPPSTSTIDRVPTDGSVNTSTSGGRGASDLLIKITGSNFTNGMGVVIPDVTVHDLVIVSGSELRFRADVPTTAALGSKAVSVTGPDGSASSGSPLTFVVTAAPAPTLPVTPAALGQGAGTTGYLAANGNTPVTITIKGDDFQPGAQLSLGPDISVTDEAVTDGPSDCIVPGVPPGCGPTPDTLTAKIAITKDAVVGKRAAVVTNPDGGSGTVPDAFTVNQGPKVTSVANAAGNPVLIPDGAAHPITILGSGFSTSTPPADVLDVIPATGVTIANVVVVDSGKITANITAATNAVKGARTMGVTNTGDKGFGSLAPVYVANKPGLPGSLKLVAGAGTLTASWTAAASNGAPITSYRVTIQRSGSSTITSRNLNGSQLSTTFSGLTNSATYTVKVNAANAAGAGPIAVKTGVPGFVATLTGKVSATLVTAGNGVTISGTLKRGTTPVALRTIKITIDPLVGATISRSVTTTSSGVWSYRYYPAYTFAARPRFSGDGVYRSAEGPLLKVSTAVRITRTSPANFSRSSSATTLKITGKVFPSKPGRYIYLYRYANGTRTLLLRTTTTSTSTFTFVGKPRRGTYTFRIYMSATTGNAAGYSAPFTIYRT